MAQKAGRFGITEVFDVTAGNIAQRDFAIRDRAMCGFMDEDRCINIGGSFGTVFEFRAQSCDVDFANPEM